MIIPRDIECPACKNMFESVLYYRHPTHICNECVGKTVDENGRPVEFGNRSLSGGYVGAYKDVIEAYEVEHSSGYGLLCYVNDIELRAIDFRFGGIVIEQIKV